MRCKALLKGVYKSVKLILALGCNCVCMTYTIKVNNGLPRKNRSIVLWCFMWDITQLMVLCRNNVICLWHNGENFIRSIVTICRRILVWRFFYPLCCSGVMRRHRYGSSLYQERVWCLTAPSHLLIQCRLIVDMIPITNFNFNSFSVIIIVLLIRKLCYF